MDQDYVIATGSGTADDGRRLWWLVRTEHPQAQKLSSLGVIQSKVRGNNSHQLWLDKEAGVLLDFKRTRAKPGKSEAEDQLTLYRYPLRSSACHELLAFLAQRPVEHLDNPGNHNKSDKTLLALRALTELFHLQLARLQLEYNTSAAIDQVIRQQVERARTPQESARRTAFRDWHVRQVCKATSKITPVDAARALGYNPNDLPLDLAQTLGSYLAYCKEITYEEITYEPVDEGPGDDRHRTRHYYEFRTVGRRLTDLQMNYLREEIRNATVEPEMLVADLMIDRSRYSLPWSPEATFAQYFDVGLHFSQSGSRNLWLRLPGALADKAMVYRLKYGFGIKVVAGDLLVDMQRWDEDCELAYGGVDPRPWLQELLPLRDALTAGDLRALYIAWCTSTDTFFATDKRTGKLVAPTPPPGMDNLTPELNALDRFLNET